MAKIDKLNKKLYIHIFKLKQGDLYLKFNLNKK